MEGEVKEGTVKYRPLGTLKVFERDLKTGEPISSNLTGFLDGLIALTSRGNRLSDKKSLQSAIYWILQTKKLQGIGLGLNGNSSDSYSIDVSFPKETVEDIGFTSADERIDSIRKPLEDFDEQTMERNMLEEYPVFRFAMSEEIQDGFPGFTCGLRRSPKDPKILEFEVKKLASTKDE